MYYEKAKLNGDNLYRSVNTSITSDEERRTHFTPLSLYTKWRVISNTPLLQVVDQNL